MKPVSKPYSSLLVSLLLFFVMTIMILSCGEKNPQGPDDNGVTLDTIPPATITDLITKVPTTSSLALLWTAPGDDGTTGRATSYDVRYSTSLITDQNWSSAIPVIGTPTPKPAGQIETHVVTGLEPATDYCFAVKTYDEIPNESGLSNCPMGTTNQEQVPPMDILDLKAVAISETEFLLSWTAPGDDGAAGTAAEYDIRYSQAPITDNNWPLADQANGEPPPKPGGEPDSFIIWGLNPEFYYFFSMKTADEVPNWSGISNNAFELGYLKFLHITRPNVTVGEETDIFFKASTSNVQINIWTVQFQPYYIVRHLVNGTFPPGTNRVTWDLLDDNGNPFSLYYSIPLSVKLLWGGEEIASASMRVSPAP